MQNTIWTTPIYDGSKVAERRVSDEGRHGVVTGRWRVPHPPSTRDGGRQNPSRGSSKPVTTPPRPRDDLFRSSASPSLRAASRHSPGASRVMPGTKRKDGSSSSVRKVLKLPKAPKPSPEAVAAGALGLAALLGYVSTDRPDVPLETTLSKHNSYVCAARPRHASNLPSCDPLPSLPEPTRRAARAGLHCGLCITAPSCCSRVRCEWDMCA